MNFFEEATLRLKQQLAVTQDKEVAHFLGLSPRAWAGRKQGSTFPEKELRALAQQRPELGIDVGYVLTGVHRGQEHLTAAAQTMRVSVLASLLGDELHKVKTSLPYEVFYAVLAGLMQRYGDVPDFDVDAARAEVKGVVGAIATEKRS